jgi:hypothetical protein
MLRGIGYVVARRDLDNPEEPRDWARFIEAHFRGLLVRFAGWSLGARRQQPQGQESASAKRPR